MLRIYIEVKVLFKVFLVNFPAKLEFRHDQLLSSVVILGLYHVVIYGVLNVGLGNQQLILVIGKDVP